MDTIRAVIAKDVTNETTMGIYKEWATKYDKDMTVDYEYTGHQMLADHAERILKPKENPTFRILDVAAGTGLIGEELTKQGFTNIDALDGSQEMLDIAAKKNIYKHLICALLGQKETVIETETYDALVTSGSFIEGHLNHTCLGELHRITKRGGYIILVMNRSQLFPPYTYLAELIPTIERMEENGCWRVVERMTLDRYAVNYQAELFIIKKQ